MGSNQLALLVLIPLHRYILCMQHYQQVYREINSNAVVCAICEVKRRHVHSASSSAVSFIACPEPKQVESFLRDTISDFCHYKWTWCIDIRGLLLPLFIRGVMSHSFPVSIFKHYHFLQHLKTHWYQGVAAPSFYKRRDECSFLLWQHFQYSIVTHLFIWAVPDSKHALFGVPIAI